MESSVKSRMDVATASMYEAMAERLTGPISVVALNEVGHVQPGVRLLDVAAGTGALSVPAAKMGAHVVATDIALGMVERLKERLNQFPNCEARVANGEHLDFPDSSFDLAFSMFGGHILSGDWRRGLCELARVVRDGGYGCVSTWRQPSGSGPVNLLAQAIRAVFPDMATSPVHEGLRLLSSEANLIREMRFAGFSGLKAMKMDYTWQTASDKSFLNDTEGLYSYIEPYANLGSGERALVQTKLLELLQPLKSNGRVELPSPALIVIGRHALDVDST